MKNYFILLLIFFFISCNDINRHDIPDNTEKAIRDSTEREDLIRRKQLDSFNKTPEGKAALLQGIKDSITTAKYATELAANKAKSEAKVGKIMNKFSCTQEKAKKILRNEVFLGMTYNMLIYMRGNPDIFNRSNYGDGERYQACWEGYTPSCFYFREDQIITSYN